MRKKYINDWTEEDSQKYFAFLKQMRERYIIEWNGRRRQDPYKFLVGGNGLTPAEDNMWGDIRRNSLEMYPQFPVGKYYLDFANPFYKVAIEVDGKYHETPEKKEKDRIRDSELKEAGWHIYRVTGGFTYRQTKRCECGYDDCKICNGESQDTGDTMAIDMRDRMEKLDAYHSNGNKGYGGLVSSGYFVDLAEWESDHYPEYEAANKELFGFRIPGKDADYRLKEINRKYQEYADSIVSKHR